MLKYFRLLIARGCRMDEGTRVVLLNEQDRVDSAAVVVWGGSLQ